MISSTEDDARRQFAVLIVCTGNICRSPLTEQLLRAHFSTEGIRVTIRSAGTRALLGSEMTPQAVAASQRLGGSPDGHTPLQITADLVEEADLVLTATRAHRADAVSLYPRAAAYTFTLNQFARLSNVAEKTISSDSVSMDPSRDLRFLVAEVAATRGLTLALENPQDDDIEDPYQQSQAVYDRVSSAIERAVAVIASSFATAIGAT